ncbi:MAG: MarR family transcriptional regulator [Hyphomicrobiaceae bacterium]|nr:MarR family transcriptional regulator [Hyphomicrobiaceae bacterium]
MSIPERDLADMGNELKLSIGRLLALARRDFLARALGHVRERQGQPLSEAQLAILPFLEPSGMRASALAERSGLSKQRVAKIVGEYERLGIIRRRPDPDDGRATIIVFTDKGRRFLKRNAEARHAVEEHYVSILGAKRLEELKKDLARLVYGPKT